MTPLLQAEQKDSRLEFSWFLCAVPTKDDQGNYIVEVSRYTDFFDYTTGKSYHLTFDATEKKECTLLIASHPKNKVRHSFLRDLCDSEKDELSHECKMRLNPVALVPRALKMGYCGVAIRLENENCSCNLVCDKAEFVFKADILEESKKCPYIDFARSHSDYLRRVIKGFPTDKFLENAKPGKDSLVLRNLMINHL